MEFTLFYLFSTLALISAVIVISARNPVHSVLFLVLVFCNATGLLLLLEVEFIAIIFLVVYVGAIAVLFLFVVMMLNIKENAPLFGSKSTGEIFQFMPIGVLIGLIFLTEIFLIVNYDLVSLSPQGTEMSTSVSSWIQIIDGVGFSGSNLETLGQVLYTYYFYFFLVAGLVLLVAIIGAIVLTLQSKPTIYSINDKNSFVAVKRQHVYQQLSRDINKAVFLASSKEFTKLF